jgi:predicted GNAT family N-acyltransferase
MGEDVIQIQEVVWGSSEYVQTLALRHEILRRPLQLMFDPMVFDSERSDIHVSAKFGDWVVGCLILTRNDKRVKMRQVAVASEWQRKGVGAKMVVFVEGLAKNSGFLEMVLHARDSAVPFYLSLGYEVVGEGFEEVGIPHHAMRRTLVD